MTSATNEMESQTQALQRSEISDAGILNISVGNQKR
jgi:hypothetical protein